LGRVGYGYPAGPIYPVQPMPVAQPIAAAQEMEALKDQAEYLQETLEGIQQRINELEKQKPEKK